MGCVWEGVHVYLFFRDVKEFTGHQNPRPQTFSRENWGSWGLGLALSHGGIFRQSRFRVQVSCSVVWMPLQCITQTPEKSPN